MDGCAGAAPLAAVFDRLQFVNEPINRSGTGLRALARARSCNVGRSDTSTWLSGPYGFVLCRAYINLTIAW